MTMHVANQVLASMRYNHPKPQVNVFVLGTVYILEHWPLVLVHFFLAVLGAV